MVGFFACTIGYRRNNAEMASDVVKSGSKRQRSDLRRPIVDAGGTTDDAAALRRRWGFRPREAYRHAHGWSQKEVGIRFREVAARMAARSRPTSAPAVPGIRIGEYERWPQGGRRPSPYVLAVLCEVYGTTVGRLLDSGDLGAMPAPDRVVVTALVDHQDRDVGVAHSPVPLSTPGRASSWLATRLRSAWVAVGIGVNGQRNSH